MLSYFYMCDDLCVMFVSQNRQWYRQERLALQIMSTMKFYQYQRNDQ